MNAPNPVPPPSGGGDARSYEPSMEEILASIRRIIADDQSLPGRVGNEDLQSDTAPASVHVLKSQEPEGSAEALEAYSEAGTNAMTAQGSIAAPQFPSPELPASEPAHASADMASAEQLETNYRPMDREAHEEELAKLSEDGEGDVESVDEQDRRAGDATEAPLFSASTNSSVASAFNVLAASRLADNSDELIGMAREMIRPLLRSWLDENLPSMVERMVREEIERVARGGH